MVFEWKLELMVLQLESKLCMCTNHQLWVNIYGSVH
jgi:hypothetical protein